MAARTTVLFLQLPQLDNDVRGQHENLHLAAVYLRHAIEKSAESPFYASHSLPAEADTLDDSHLADLIVARRPGVIACTLYLWNVERSLRVINLVRSRLPCAKVIVGGPEVAQDHPFLFSGPGADVAVCGEGEAILPAVLRALRIGKRTDLENVGWRRTHAMTWGSEPAPRLSLGESLPPPRHRLLVPDAQGMAYLEASRGCPFACTYCRYPHFRRGITCISADEVVKRVHVLRERGATEIRFIDPTFNSHPEFYEILRRLARLNRSRSLRFFAEVKAETLTPRQFDLLAAARFAEVEIGVQSTDREVLRRIQRPTDLPAVERGIRSLGARGVKVTVDLMYGLPGQALTDIRRSLRWALRFKKAEVQCLQTLMLPGTDIRAQRRQWKMKALSQPPYGVTQTSRLTKAKMKQAETLIHAATGMRLDASTTRFVGRALPDLFAEQLRVRLPLAPGRALELGKQARRAILFEGMDLYSHRQAILRLIRRAVTAEPHILWQFVLAPDTEEPLDLLELLIAELRHRPEQVIDRWASVQCADKRASRRVFVQFRPGRKYDAGWVEAAQELLAASFY